MPKSASTDYTNSCCNLAVGDFDSPNGDSWSYPHIIDCDLLTRIDFITYTTTLMLTYFGVVFRLMFFHWVFPT